MHTFLTPEPIVLEIRNAAGNVRVDLSDTATTTVEITASSQHPLGFLDDVLRSVGSRGWLRGFGQDRAPSDGFGDEAFEDERADDPVDRVKVLEVQSTDGGPRTLVIDTDQARNGWRTSFSIRVTAPSGSGVRVQTQSADVSLTGEADRLEIRSASGDVTVDRAGGRAVVQSASGDVTITSAGPTEVRTASGEITLREATADAVLHSTSGDIRVGRADADLSARSVSGDVRLLDLTRGRIEAVTVSGSVEIGIHPGALAAVDLSTISGNTQSDLEVSDDQPVQPLAESGNPIEVDDAALDVRVKTTSGDIRLRRAMAV